MLNCDEGGWVSRSAAGFTPLIAQRTAAADTDPSG